MPARSQAQQKAAGAALAAKRGETDPRELFGAAREMYETMTWRTSRKRSAPACRSMFPMTGSTDRFAPQCMALQ